MNGPDALDYALGVAQGEIGPEDYEAAVAEVRRLRGALRDLRAEVAEMNVEYWAVSVGFRDFVQNLVDRASVFDAIDRRLG